MRDGGEEVMVTGVMAEKQKSTGNASASLIVSVCERGPPAVKSPLHPVCVTLQYRQY